MDQKKTKKWIDQALIGYAVFLVCAYSLKIFLVKLFGFGDYSFLGSPWGFYHLTIIFSGALFSSLLLIDYKFTTIVSMSSYFLGLIFHAIVKTVWPQINLLLSFEGLYQRILLTTILSIIAVIIEIVYKSFKRKKDEIKKRDLLNNKFNDLSKNEN